MATILSGKKTETIRRKDGNDFVRKRDGNDQKGNSNWSISWLKLNR